jgi:large repetitive protein
MRSMSANSLSRTIVGLATLLVTLSIALPSGAVGGRSLGKPTWSAGVEVPGTSSINTGGTAGANDISCTKAGDCVAVGTYATSSTASADFVTTESGGTWGPAEEIPGYATLNVGSLNNVDDFVDCPSTGNCTIVGTYANSSNYLYPFTVSETDGTWGSALELTGFPEGNGDSSATVTALSCSGVGDCVASGEFYNGALSVYNAIETSGVWGTITTLGGLAALDTGGSPSTTSLSCTSAGNCGETGLYTIGTSTTELAVFVANETSGTWGSAVALPGLAALNVGNAAAPEQISCSGPGDCVVGGQYSLSTTQFGAFIASEAGGTWASAEIPSGIATLDVGHNSAVSAVSCTNKSTCVVGGDYNDAAGSEQAFVEDEINGTWASATEVPGSSTLNNGGAATILATSCSSPGNCGATGAYTDNQGNVQAFVVNQTSGTWGSAIEVAGVQALNLDGFSEGDTISCAPDGSCGVGGAYTDGSNDSQAFVASSNAILTVPGAPSIRATSKVQGSITVTIKAPASNGGDAVTGYEYSLNGGGWVKSGTSSTITIRHLKVKSSYHVRVRALNLLGTGATSGTQTVTIV